MAVADLVVVPVKPGELDFEAAMATVTIAQSQRAHFALVPNDSTYISIAMGETVRMILEMGLPLLPTVHHRVATMLKDGLTASERAKITKSAIELEALWSAIDRVTMMGRAGR
jgi:chromosome partitioning protein